MQHFDFTRRGFVSAVSGTLAAGLTPFSALSAATPVSLPEGPLLLSRELCRSLRDGKTILVKRDWEVRFTQQARGCSIHGRQVSVSVEAPPALAPLTAIEESRSTAGMFPILLSPEGTIMAAGPATSAQSLAMAVIKADEIIAQRKAGEDYRNDFRNFAAELEKAGGSMLDQMPGDLFFPSTQPLREVRRIASSQDLAGEFALSWKASVQPGTRLLASAKREVTTRIGPSERTSWERWSLDPA